MRKALAALVLIAISAFAANLRLYLKDGSYHIVREYSVQKDRVRFYSVERSGWEEIPADLVDLKRTENDVVERKQKLAEEAKVISAEDKVEREQAEEISKIPQNPGVYQLIDKKELRILHLAESKIHNNKRRSVLKAISPIPLVSGKATLELDELHSKFNVENEAPEFYIQIEREERFGIVRLIPHENVRIAEKLTIIPVSKEVVEEPEEVEIFRRQLDQNGLYKIWPQKPLEPGEYAVVEYTPGKLNMQIWDFTWKPGAKYVPDPHYAPPTVVK